MKEYQEPTATIVEFSVKDIVICSGGGPPGTGGDEETESGSIFTQSIRGSNGVRFD